MSLRVQSLTEFRQIGRLLPCPRGHAHRHHALSSTMRVVGVPVSILLNVGRRWQIASITARFVAQTALREKMPDKKPFSRLPKDVVPKNYAIRLKPDLSKLTFEGQQAITVQVASYWCSSNGPVRTRYCTSSIGIPHFR